MITGLWLPATAAAAAALDRALPERLHASGWNFILGGSLLKHMKDTEEEAIHMSLLRESVGGRHQSSVASPFF